MGILGATCAKEEMNFLAINLAHEIVTGKKTVEEARAFYGKTAAAFMKGEKSPYTQKQLFEAMDKKEAMDPDKGLDSK